MESAKQLTIERRCVLNRTLDTNPTPQTPVAVRPIKTPFTSVYKSLRKTQAHLQPVQKRQTESARSKQPNSMSVVQNTVLRSTPAKKPGLSTLDTKALTRPNPYRPPAGPGIQTIREFCTGSPFEEKLKKIIKSKSSVVIGDGALDPVRSGYFLPDFVQAHPPKLDGYTFNGAPPMESPKPKIMSRAVLDCLKKYTPMQKKNRLYTSAVEVNHHESRLATVHRKSFVNSSVKPRHEMFRVSTCAYGSTREWPRKATGSSHTNGPAVAPAMGITTSRVVTPTNRRPYMIMSYSDSVKTGSKSISKKTPAENDAMFSRWMERHWGSLIKRLSVSKTSDLLQRAGDYYIKDLDDAYAGRTEGYFADMFKVHFRKSALTLDAMKDLELCRMRLRMTPIFLDGEGGVRPAIPENINIYLNYQLTNRTCLPEPNFYKQSYESILAKKLDLEAKAPSRVASETKGKGKPQPPSLTHKRTSLRPALWRGPRPQSKGSFSTDPETEERPRKTIIFDLDETLIHSCKTPNERFDRSVTARMPSQNEKTIGFNVRPHFDDLIDSLKDDFELVIFTASHYCYASPILDDIDPQRRFKTRLFREHCDLVNGGIFIKNLAILKDRDLKNVVLVDNSVSSFASQVSNGIPILPFFDNKADDQLLKLKWFLLRLKDCDDVRPVIAEHFAWADWKAKYLRKTEAPPRENN